jgi:hypothetical protein
MTGLSVLAGRQRAALALVMVGDHTNLDVADLLELPPATVRALLWSCLRDLEAAGSRSRPGEDAKAEQLWSAPLKTWLPGGLDTPGLALFKVHAETAEYWDSPPQQGRPADRRSSRRGHE